MDAEEWVRYWGRTDHFPRIPPVRYEILYPAIPNWVGIPMSSRSFSLFFFDSLFVLPPLSPVLHGLVYAYI